MTVKFCVLAIWCWVHESTLRRCSFKARYLSVVFDFISELCILRRVGCKITKLPKGDILKPALSCFDHNTANNGLSQLMLMPPDHSNCLAPLFLNLLLGDQADGKQMAGGRLWCLQYCWMKSRGQPVSPPAQLSYLLFYEEHVSQYTGCLFFNWSSPKTGVSIVQIAGISRSRKNSSF